MFGKPGEKDGEPFPTCTMNQLLSGLKRYNIMLERNGPNVLDEKNPHFSGLRGVRDTISRELHQKGVAVGVKHSEVISSSEEELLWEKGILGIDSHC